MPERRTQPNVTLGAFVLLLGLCGLPGCSESTPPSPEGSGQQTGQTGQQEQAENTPDPGEAAREAERDSLRGELSQSLNRLALSRGVETRMRQVLEVEGRITLRTWRREVLLELYGEQDFRTLFLSPEESAGLADSLLMELRAAHQHALNADVYRLDRLDRAADEFTSLAVPTPPEWPLTDMVLDSLGETRDVAPAVLAEQLAGIHDGQGDTDVAAAFDTYSSQVAVSLGASVEFELLLADAFLSYARDMALGNTNRLTEGELLELGGTGQVVADRLREAFRSIAAMDVPQFEDYLEALIPSYPQYPLLMEQLARYRGLVEAGGWQRVQPRSLELGSNNSRVSQLKERLAIEGYYEGPIDNNYGEALAAAVTSYQESHQMPVTGQSHNMFWGSINVPADQRLAQIELTLQRWRESRIGDDPYYVFVNVPDFHAELWRDGERLTRFRVVTGNRTQECDPETGLMRYVNATPLITAQIEYLVYNPYWNVPDRIRREELDLELMENPSWLQENGYEVVLTNGAPRIRQLPGPENALGAVKFIFPNIHNIYMHDTPRQRYFDFPIRAYSHGCVRVHEPLAFAEVLLRQDNNWDEERINRIREAAVERTVRLSTAVPIHIEYYVVRIDDQGRTNFLSDIYRYDRIRLGDVNPEDGVCEPVVVENEEAIVVNWEGDGTANLPDGTVVHADGTVVLSEARLAEVNGEIPEPEELVAPIDPTTVDTATEGEAGDIGP